MKKIIYVLMLVLGMSVLLYSCEKEGGNGSSKLIGTWDCISTVYEYVDAETETEGNVGDYVVITDKTLTFYYGDSGTIWYDNGVPYEYSFDGSTLFLSGVGKWTVKSLTNDSMVWEDTAPAQKYMPHETITWKKRK